MRVPPERFMSELQAWLRRLGHELEKGVKFVALEQAYEHAVSIAPRDTGKAAWGLNPSFGEPKAVDDENRPQFPLPGFERMAAIEGDNKPGKNGFLTFHALDVRGVYDYAGNQAGRSLEKGWSPQAPRGVLGPTKEWLEKNGDMVISEGVELAKMNLGI